MCGGPLRERRSNAREKPACVSIEVIWLVGGVSVSKLPRTRENPKLLEREARSFLFFSFLFLPRSYLPISSSPRWVFLFILRFDCSLVLLGTDFFCRFNNGSSGCLACLYKSKVVVSEAPKELLHCTERRNPTVSEDFWTNCSTLDMETNARARSQGRVSSITASNATVDDSRGGGSDPSELVNHGLILWNQTRKRWLGSKTKPPEMRERHEPVLSKKVTYESLLGSNKPFPRPVPLSEMVQFLVEAWEQEGLYG